MGFHDWQRLILDGGVARFATGAEPCSLYFSISLGSVHVGLFFLFLMFFPCGRYIPPYEALEAGLAAMLGSR